MHASACNRCTCTKASAAAKRQQHLLDIPAHQQFHALGCIFAIAGPCWGTQLALVVVTPCVHLAPTGNAGGMAAADAKCCPAACYLEGLRLWQICTGCADA